MANFDASSFFENFIRVIMQISCNVRFWFAGDDFFIPRVVENKL